MLENKQRLVELGIALANLFAKNCDLRVLTAQAQYRCTGNVGVVNVTGDEGAEVVGVFARASTATFVKQEADAVDVLEQAAALGWSGIWGEGVKIDLFRLPFATQLGQFGDLAAVELGRSESEFLFEGLLQDVYVLVLAKNQRDDEPIVSCTHLTVRAAISLEGLILPVRNVGWRPTV